MLKHLLGILLIWVFSGLIGCPTGKPARNPMDRRPDDFAVLYEWQEGSLPPPYYYEYRINLQPSGNGEVTMIPDYPSERVPVWTETFTVQIDTLDELYRMMIARGLLTKDWQTQSLPSVGGSREFMTVMAHRKRIAIPARVIHEQESQVGAMYSALRTLVPKAIWDKLNTQRGQYVKEHQERR